VRLPFLALLRLGVLSVVDLVEHELLLADAPEVRGQEVDVEPGHELEREHAEHDRHDLAEHLHLRIDGGLLALAGHRLTGLVPTAGDDEQHEDVVGERGAEAASHVGGRTWRSIPRKCVAECT